MKMKPISQFKTDAFDLLCANFAHLKEVAIQAAIEKYIDVVTDEVWRNWMSHNILGNLAFVRKEQIRRDGGRVCVEKGSRKQIYLDNWFKPRRLDVNKLAPNINIIKLALTIRFIIIDVLTAAYFDAPSVSAINFAIDILLRIKLLTIMRP